MQNEIACKSYQEGRNETHTNQSETRQDCFNCHSRKFRVTIHSNHSTEGINRMKALNMYLLWDEYLREDKRSFREYFQEEYGIIIDEWTSYETVKTLCEALIKTKK